MQKLESDIMPLQQANSELSEKSGMLQAEKRMLEDEIKRWKVRTQVCDRTSIWTDNVACMKTNICPVNSRNFDCPAS